MNAHNKPVCVPGKPYQPSLMFVGKDWSPKVKNLKGLR